MNIKLVLFIFGISQAFANNMSNTEYYYPDEDNGALMIKAHFNKLNTILEENNKISNYLKEINASLQNLTEDVTTIKKFLNESSYAKSLTQNHVWTIIQRRQDGSVNFYRNWTDYKNGFGNPNGEFFIGLAKLHELTTFGAPQELMIILKDFEGQTRYASYDKFVIGSELEKFSLKELGKYSGDAKDSLTRHKGSKFSTEDQDHDGNSRNCAKTYKGGWWFHDGCYTSNLNGPYLKGHSTVIGGINWYDWRGFYYSLKYVEMMIRSKA